ncbi:IclR family transcriptional regulator [Pseudosulfitobacter sp. DSM 107133]|uniref:IclR family transcriptional regulator n=1 Tax=Pseudosulfitobacter sp. DSM 107133 TaxID=2883100 RepID=UPI001962DE79|nr:IclR family transcriptional regulator [Pseudosulfitobacter sp. DSM 107133]
MMNKTVTEGAKRPEYSVQPVVRALAVLRYIAAGNRCRKISGAAKATGVNRTTLIRILATLEAERIIEALPDEGGYRLGTGLISLAAEALNDRGIVPSARPVLSKLVEKLKLSAHLGVREGHEIVYLARETPVSHLASTVREGTRLPAHATTIGRILLAELKRQELQALYADYPLEAYTAKTRTTLDALMDQLADDRARGVSWSMANFEPEIGSAAAPVYDHRGEAVAAINVTGYASIFTEGTEQAALIERTLKDAAQEISEALGYRGWAADQM